MTTVSFSATPDVARTLFEMAMHAPDHLYFTAAHETIRQAAINAMLNCSRQSLPQLIERANQLPGFAQERYALLTHESDISKTICLAQLLSSQKKENLKEFFKNTPLKANL